MVHGFRTNTYSHTELSVQYCMHITVTVLFHVLYQECPEFKKILEGHLSPSKISLHDDEHEADRRHQHAEHPLVVDVVCRPRSNNERCPLAY